MNYKSVFVDSAGEILAWPLDHEGWHTSPNGVRVRIGEGVTISIDCCLSDRVVIGANSWIGPHCRFGSQVELGANCLLPSGCQVGAGTRVRPGSRLEVGTWLCKKGKK